VFSALSTSLITAQAVVEAQTLPDPPRPQQASRVLTQSEKTSCPPSETTLNQNALVQEQAESEIAIDLLEPFAPLDGGYGPFAAHLFDVAGLEHEKRNYEILAIAADRASLAYVSAWPAPNQFFLNKTAALSLSNALTLGNMEEADKFWQVFKETLSFAGVPADKIYELYPKLAQQLVWAGRLEDAEILTRKLVSRFDGQKTDYIDSYHYTDYRYRQPVLKACAQVLAARHAEEANALVDPLFEMEMDNLWLGDFCRKLGKLDKALACYKRAIVVEEKRSSLAKDSWYCCQWHCYALYRAAEIQRIQGKGSEAKALLNQAKTVYRSTAAAQTSSTAKPNFRPTMADLEAAIVDPVAIAGPVAPELPASESVALEMLPQFKLLTTINQAIESGASSAAPIAQLLELYKKSPPVITAERPPLNYYCALLGVARRLSDKKLYDQSDDLLRNLLVIAPEHEAALGLNMFTVAEIAINAERQGKNSATSWAKARKKIAGLDQFASNRFRYLALAYGAAGEYQRAQVVLKHAEKLSDSESAVKKNLRGRVLLLLDKANLAAAQGQFAESEACFNLALDQFVALNKGSVDVAKIETATGTAESSIQNSDTIDIYYRIDFESKLLTKAVTLARINIEKKQVAAAERDLRKIMSLNWTAPSNSQTTSLNTVQIYNLSPIKVELARLLSARGEFEQARALLSKTSEGWDNSFGELCLFTADCAAAVKDWPTALDGYMTAPFQGQSINPTSAIPGFAEFSLNKALAASTHISAPDKSKLSSLYQSMAQVYEMAPYSPEQAVKFYRKAYEICPDNSS
jgi:tetratricopeptide (TPR) repeat protein